MTSANRPDSVAASTRWLRALERTTHIKPESTQTFWKSVLATAEVHGDRAALIGDDYALTYRQLIKRAQAYACWGRQRRLRRGDQVSLFMENQPDYVAIWLGLSSIGVVTALLNTQLVGESLAYCVNLAEPSCIITSASLLTKLHDIDCSRDIWLHDDSFYTKNESYTGMNPDIDETNDITLADVSLLIYTSGTTGLPKAARVTHFRVIMWSEWFAGITAAGESDRLYNCLPMYHSVGGVVAIGAMLVSGGAVIIRKKFAASDFWRDLTETRATIFQYIGELCRYLSIAPQRPHELSHSLRLCVGNGLRADVWEKFSKRFEIPMIFEFYAATEGSFSLFNLEGRIGAIGRIPRFLAHLSPIALVQYDHERQQPLRGQHGFCLKCASGEVGEAIGRLQPSSGSAATRFEGYTHEGETNTKLLRDVFKQGDCWFRTGDLMRQDTEGFFYFVDRIGDTYRWKGENVATIEVAAKLASLEGVLDSVVFGVPIQQTEGRAGMAVLVTSAGFDLVALSNHLRSSLPSYAHPVFLRLTKNLALTSSYKLDKKQFVQDGFNPSKTEDPLFVRCYESGLYYRLDSQMYDDICLGKRRM